MGLLSHRGAKKLTFLQSGAVIDGATLGRVKELQYSSRSRPVYLVMPLMRSVLSIEEHCTAGIARRHAAA